VKINSKKKFLKEVFPFFLPIHPRFPSMFVKSANRINKFFIKMQYKYKKAEFDADFESVEKLRKILCDKIINEKVT
jgi:hypothetical protein